MSKRRRNQVQVPVISDPVQIANTIALSDAERAFLAQRATNGLADAIGYPSSPLSGIATEPTSSTNTILANLRYYLITNLRQILSEAYVEIGLISTIVDVPVDDAFRGGIELKSNQLDENQLKELSDSMEHDDDLVNVAQTAKWNRLFGGGGTVVWLSDQDPYKPLNVAAIGPDTEMRFIPADMWELFWNQQNISSMSPMMPHNFTHYDYYGEKVHKSRVMAMRGIEPPSFIRPRLRGWGVSVVEILVRSINQYLKATDLGFQVLDEFKLDIYKIKNLNAALASPIGTQKIMQRIQLANYQKNYQNAVVMDAEDDHDSKQLSFAGLAEAMMGIRMQVAADMRMPMIKLFGTPAQGLNASDESSMEVYNSMVESQVRNKLKKPIIEVARLKCQKLFGMVPDDLTMSFKPMRVLTAIDEQTVKTQKFTRLHQAQQAGLITVEEYRDACNKGDIFDITLSKEALAEVEGQIEEQKAAMEPEPGGEDKAKNALNSAAFDRASYEADGGDAWIDPKRLALYEDPQDKALWARAKEASVKAYGEERLAFQAWLYHKFGARQ